MSNTVRGVPADRLGDLVAAFMAAGLAFSSVWDDTSETFTLTVTGY